MGAPRGRIVAAGLAAAALLAAPAAGDSGDPVGKAATAAVKVWQKRLVKVGWVGLQGEIAGCFSALDERPTQAKAAYCLALDECTVLDTKAFPPALIPEFFRDEAFDARRKAALAAVTTPKQRGAFDNALQRAIQPCLRAAERTAAGLRR